MSLNKSATRRFSLLTSASLVAASLTAFTATSLSPTSAYAYDECVPANAPTTQTDGVGGASDPGLNGPTADSFSCNVSSYANGIAYSSNGDLTVTKTITGVTVIVADGIRLTGNGADSVTWISSLAGVAGGAAITSPGPVGPLLEIVTDTGAINVTTGVITANRAGTTYGIRAVSTGGGNITTTSTQSANNNVEGGLAGIYAQTAGGNISITNGNAQGRRRGVFAQTSGAGSVALTLGGAVASAVDGVAAVDVTAGAGAISITSASGTINGGAGTGIIASTTGAITMNLANVSGSTRAINATSGGALNLTVTSTVTGGSGGAIMATSGGALNLTMNGTGSSLSGGAGAALVGVSTGGATITNTGTIGAATGGGRIDLSGVTGGGVTFTNSGAFGGRWLASGASVFSGGNDLLSMSGTVMSEMASGASINFGGGADTFNLGAALMAADASLDFGAGADVFNLTGRLTVRNAMTITGAEAFNNTGAIFLGGLGGANTDYAPGDILTVTGGTFTGSGGGRIAMDVSFASGGQTDCSTAEAADCVIFDGATTAGSTLLTIINADGSSASGSSSRTTVIVGSTGADDFVLDPNSFGYVTTPQGGAIRKRLFDYYLLYDDTAEQHLLAAVPHIEAFQIATFAASSQDIWRTTTGSWFDRQADLRATPGGLEPSFGVWGRAGVGAVDRDVILPLDLLGTAFQGDVSYKQRTAHAMFGADLVGAATQGATWVVGINGGFMRSDADYEAPATEVVYAGFAGGLYASLVAGPLFVDAAVSANVLDVNTEMASLAFDSDVQLAQTIRSLGGQVEAGWRIAAGAMFAEPLVAVSYVTTKLDGIEVPGQAGTFEFEDATSLRAGAGMRLGADSALMGQAASYSLTGRYWSEMEGENMTGLAGNVPTVLVDDFSGSFAELVGSLGLYSGDGVVSGFVNLGGKFADGYQSLDGSAGLRMRW